MSSFETQTTKAPTGRPTIVAGVTASRFGSLGRSLEHSAAHEFFATDVDLRMAPRAPVVAPVSSRQHAGLVRIRAVWIPGSLNGMWVERRRAGLWRFLDHAAAWMGLRTVILPRSSDVVRGEFLGAELRRRMEAASHGAVRLAIGINGSAVHRGHDQLAQLQSLRHTAEEWDLDIALDLAGDVPHYLEAEAAVLRLLPKLTLVRIPSWVSTAGELNANDPISRRVVAILADQGYAGTISIIPARSSLLMPWAHTYPSMSDEWTRSLILDQYDRQRTDNRSAPYSSPELFREQY
jgi:hypothetical protein